MSRLGICALALGLGAATAVLDARFDALDDARLSGAIDDPWVLAEVRLARALTTGASDDPEALFRLARARLPPEHRDALVAATGLDAAVVGALLLDAAALEGALACAAGHTSGEVGATVRAALCPAGARARATEAVDAALATLLAGGEKEAAWVIEVAAGLGSRGVAVAERSLALPAAHPIRRDAAALMLRARAAEPEASLAVLKEALLRPGPLGTVAVLELARLRAHPSALDAFAADRAETADAVLAGWALHGR